MAATSTAFLSSALLTLVWLCDFALCVKHSDMLRLPQNSKEIGRGYLIGCECSPSARGFSLAAMELMEKAVKRIQKDFRGYEPFDHRDACIAQNGVESCINADRDLRSRYKRPFCFYHTKTGKNLGAMFFNDTDTTDYYTLPACDLSNSTRSPDNLVIERLPPLNEGCVAVEHLQGYVLQHPEHLLRQVLCAKGFCATPNHAIEVNGRRTSMKEMCGTGGWKCAESVKRVNNLKISANMRAKINEEITITPYDVRFPRAVIWAVQILEDVLRIVAVSVGTGTLTAISLLALSFAKDSFM